MVIKETGSFNRTIISIGNIYQGPGAKRTVKASGHDIDKIQPSCLLHSTMRLLPHIEWAREITKIRRLGANLKQVASSTDESPDTFENEIRDRTHRKISNRNHVTVFTFTIDSRLFLLLRSVKSTYFRSAQIRPFVRARVPPRIHVPLPCPFTRVLPCLPITPHYV